MTDALGLKRPRRRVAAQSTTAEATSLHRHSTPTSSSSATHSRKMFSAMVGLNHRKRSPSQTHPQAQGLNRSGHTDLCSSSGAGGGDKEDPYNHNTDDNDSIHSAKPKPLHIHGPTQLWRFLVRARSSPWQQTLNVMTLILTAWGLWMLLGNYLIAGPAKAFRRMQSSNAWGTHPRVTTLLPPDPLKAMSTSSHHKEQFMLQSILHENLPPLHHTVAPLASEDFIEGLKDSYEYGDIADPLETKECKAQYDWQLHSFPSCNHLHERELQSSIVQPETGHPLVWVASGYWRDVWIMPDTAYDDPLVLKTIRYTHDYTERNYDRHRRDALAMERLTDHPYILDIYAFCGNSGVFEFAGGGDIGQLMFPEDSTDDERQQVVKANSVSKLERLHIAVQVAMGLAAVHNSDKEGRSAIAHTDISPGQFVRVNGRFKLNDFNRARFLRTNVTDGSLCPFHVGKNPGRYPYVTDSAFAVVVEMTRE